MTDLAIVGLTAVAVLCLVAVDAWTWWGRLRLRRPDPPTDPIRRPQTDSYGGWASGEHRTTGDAAIRQLVDRLIEDSHHDE
jgi:hypothetical protein